MTTKAILALSIIFFAFLFIFRFIFFSFEKRIYVLHNIHSLYQRYTHIPLDTCEYVGEKRIHLFNPGSIGNGGTYGIVHTSEGVLVTSIAKA